jgi:glycosyltransferase involved in cell wall biosynthesis
MRVLHVILGLWRGGEQSLTHGCICALSGFGVQSEVYAYHTGREADTFAAVAPTVVASRVELHDLIRTRGFDVVHLINGQAELGAIESMARSGLEMGIVVSYHSLTGFAPVWSRRNASVGTAVSEYLRNRLKAYTDLPLHVVLNGVDVARFSPAPPHQPGDRPILAWVGRTDDPAKDFGALLDVVAEPVLDGYEVWVADPSPQRWVPRGRASAVLRIARWEAVPMSEMPAFYRQVASSGGALLSTSVSEGGGGPLCLMEAMACGCPVVAPAVMGIPELLEDRRNGLLYPPSAQPEEVARLVRALDQEPFRSRLVAEALRTVAERFTVQQTARAYLRTYEQAVAAPVRPLPPDGSEWRGFRRWFFLYGREMRRAERRASTAAPFGVPAYRYRHAVTACVQALWHCLRGDRWARRRAARVAWTNAGYLLEALAGSRGRALGRSSPERTSASSGSTCSAQRGSVERG